jgi:hypothetical protein
VSVPALEEVLHLQTQLGEHVFRFAPSKALDKRASVLALRHRQARLVVVVTGALRLVALASMLYALQPFEHEIHGPHCASSLEPPCGMIRT